MPMRTRTIRTQEALRTSAGERKASALQLVGAILYAVNKLGERLNSKTDAERGGIVTRQRFL